MARYAVWLTAEASCVAAGLGTFASDQPTTLDEGKITNIRILRVELATSSNEFWMNWNVRTQAYMSNCVYKRLPLASRPVKVFATFLFSAVWHGMSFRYLGSLVSSTRKIFKLTSRAGWGVACALLQVLFPGRNYIIV